ncbi:hypothetical protein GLOTRDRAFT_133266 [Gloeophyllum trabeum ATCC 11539]|uniref:Uncharacterized protein n=1 Tax=Gloeophyllum trabeum (strain ATCC 11539 / FP-39264 / Madison 617) TaxID=670483 RepID=S7RFW0_GLOTA|nr:uncharacterized protein GLOTRDRAFT_133266 [Gloeophyllum trabeum ATCC 11539]EPQ51404.1 hypothetical protein GLOTRDRAFT_133266 [Gloeophyllum trabeum ATCC 11539]
MSPGIPGRVHVTMYIPSIFAAGFIIEQEQAHEWVRRYDFEPESEKAYVLVELDAVVTFLGIPDKVRVFGLSYKFKNYGKPT